MRQRTRLQRQKKITQKKSGNETDEAQKDTDKKSKDKQTTSTDIDSSQVYKFKQVQLMHYYTMNLEDGQQISIVSNAHNTATIIKNINTTLPPTFQYQLAKTLQEAAKPSRTGNRMGCYVAVKNTKQIDLDKVSEDFLRSKKILAPQYSYVMDCKCRKLVRTDTEEMKQKTLQPI